ncbi:glycerol-3-phosphate dehydrogenase/oxidase [Planococcus salinus]|uniref:Glycerol-3-phosphate dehydrogenase n=1 Tax=Planococcus salinus TaxID=1848460 RepID=A0A3M8P722_9BACL|nr:glycerol-3-phosphate dehydrogenase/oxidase [Planococcus salinus]RNF39506.1 glycerol-3-phosphate dehydrogenase/oxidase [Planococcus salinus]
MKLSALNRAEVYQKMKQGPLDLLVIGGGITGAGIALDAANRGMKVGLIEMQDFAAGTSSRSTKLIHGGLRYLKQFEVKLVAEVGKEREIVYENGPHVTTPVSMMLPFYKGGSFGPYSASFGLRLYDFLAGVKKEERRQMLTKKQALKREPLLRKQGLKGAGSYVEYKTDDARLTLEVLKKAGEQQALALNYVKATAFIYSGATVTGIRAEDQLDGGVHEVYARKIVNATGPWVDSLRERDQSRHGKTLLLTKGSHLVFDQQKFPLRQAVYFDAPDGRMVFAIPREGKVYVGTTDTVYNQDPRFPAVSKEDWEYLLAAVVHIFPQVKVKPEDIESSWAGIRPLIREEGKGPSEISRRDEVFISASGLISIAGGKLTGYRKMAENIVDLVAEQLRKERKIKFARVSTKDLPISGGEMGGSKNFSSFLEDRVAQGMLLGLDHATSRRLVQRYGANVDQIFRFYGEGKRKPPALDPLVYAMLQYAINYEAACSPTDFFERRTGALYFDIKWVYDHKESVMAHMAAVFNWTHEQAADHRQELERVLYQANHPLE